MYINDTGIADFLDSNGVNTSFINDLPSFNVSLDLLVDTFIDNQDDIAVLKASIEVVDTFDSPVGKVANTFGNLIILDSRYFIDLITEMLNTLSKTFSAIIFPNLPSVI